MLYKFIPESLPRPLRASEGAVWDYIKFQKHPLQKQGWKIHVSSSVLNAGDTLRKCASVADRFGTDFKYATSLSVLKSINGKQWPRSGSGKFMTFYPHSDDVFLNLGQALSETLQGLEGPYILSDRIWPGSECVFYRYGGFKRLEKVNPDGARSLHIVDQKGNWIPDSRTPYWSLPDWVTDPLHDATANEPTIHSGPIGERYIVTEAISFSSRGGVYLANDTLDDHLVVIKEARPLISVGDAGDDSQSLLSQEYRTLLSLRHEPAFVHPIDHFVQGPHSFLVEEHIEGKTLGRYSVLHNPLYSGRLTVSRIDKYLMRMLKIWRQLHQAISAAHGVGIILGDLSLNNVIIDEDDTVRIIDVEGAFQADDLTSNPGIVTPGFFPRGKNVDVTYSRDWYAYGAIMLGTLFVANGIVHLEPATLKRYCDELRRDTDLPIQIIDLILEIYSSKGKGDWAANILNALNEIEQQLVGKRYKAALTWTGSFKEIQTDKDKISKCVSDVKKELEATYNQNELPAWKSDKRAVEKNPFCVAYGLSGVCYALDELGGNGREIFAERMVNAPYSELPAGLYVGAAGISWVATELKNDEIAKVAYGYALSNGQKYDDLSLYYGRAGVGLLGLRLHSAYKDDVYLENALAEAEDIKNRLLETSDGRLYHADAKGNFYIGLGHGGSGISTFYSELYRTTGEEKFLQLSKKLLLSDFKAARWRTGGFIGFPEQMSKSNEPMTSPSCYLHSGTSGVIKAAMQYLKLSQDEEVHSKFTRFIIDIERKYTSFPQYERGLSGVLHTLNILRAVVKRKSVEMARFEACRGLLITAIDTDNGITFPGDQGRETSLDFATGAAGIALELYRYGRPAPHSNILF